MSNSLTADIFATLDVLVLERIEIGRFRISGKTPQWLRRFCNCNLKSGMDILIPKEQFPFLENFLIDAEEFWQQDRDKIFTSGVWNNSDIAGKEFHFEAKALIVEDKKILLIELLNQTYEQMHSLIQKARENQLNYQHILKENQKKEVLIHCIIHDIAGQLSGINCCLSLLELENLTPKGRERLEVGRKQSIKQEMLIREVLNAFSSEVQSLESFTADPDSAPNILMSTLEVMEILTPMFALNKLQLELADGIDKTADWRVVGEKNRLDRMIANLLENASRYSPPNSTITIDIRDEGEYIFMSIDDEGPGISPEVAGSLFQKFSQGQTKLGRSGLGLYFCRITVERWGGTIGFSNRSGGGSRFWFRVLKPVLRNRV